MDLIAIWQSCDSTIKASIIGAGATCAAAFFGFSAVVFQIGAQGRQSRRSIIENERRKLKASMYEDAVAVTRVMADAAIELANEIRGLDMQLAVASLAAGVGMSFDVPTARFPEILAAYGRFSDSTIKLIFLVENRRVIDPRLLIFRAALNSVLHNTNALMFSEFMMHVMPIVPVENPNGGTFPYEPPKKEDLPKIKEIFSAFIDNVEDSIAYTDDFLVDLQNLLLSDLFDNKVEHRVPLDPAKRTITIENFKEIESWLNSNTAFGKTTADIDSNVAAKYR
ncbi:hypothetical protein EUV02_11360 [Polymorphobacter arshaanensis]|uniref:Uncharacterized protein n=1 Tax=Glacieibacterium arshaanense TaxID=2511025 RepID=A0A4Y9EPE5_9SPHN|nr:hypothetical protein [Polymorphobacter arshaanensis]TFU03733.1 hypothetical protein EUV02_11360 [Polymorphobacter arshaanensis]